MKKLIIYSVFILLTNSFKQNSNSICKNESKLIVSNTEMSFLNKRNNNSFERNRTKECSPSSIGGYLNDPDKSGTNIRVSPKGNVITKLIVDDLNHDYLLKLTESKNGWFKIEGPIQGIVSDIELPEGKGWIHGSVISVDTRNYDNQHLSILDKPKTGKVLRVIKEVEIGLRLKELCGEWIKVEHDGIVGWIESKWLCGNPLTNCS